jgi:hypothetical protein
MSGNNSDTTQEFAMDADMASQLATLLMGGKKKLRKEISTEVVRDPKTRHIILPPGMSKLTASEELKKQYENEEKIIAFTVAFEGWNWQDVLVAIKKVTEKEFGWMNAQDTMTFFGPQPPREIDIEVDIKDGKYVTEKAFFGEFCVTYWDNAKSSISVRGGVVTISLQAKKKFSEDITKYFNLIREHLNTASIYRGRNIVVTDGGEGKLDFKIIENKGSDMIILNEDTEMVVEEFVLASLSEKGKRTYLLTGGYGNGKTESVMRIGRVAVEQHGMSFFYVKNSDLFEAMLNLSKNYQPAIIFLEDIDEIAAGSNRDSRMNSILNILDGVETKGNNLTVVFTTNHPEKINKALRRPGRIDLMIKFENPTHETTEKIMRVYFDKLPGGQELDYGKLVQAVADIKTINKGDKTDKTVGVPGAVIAEICKRAVKLAANKGGEIADRTVLSSISSIKYQVELMAGDVEEMPKEKKLWEMIVGQMSEAVAEAAFDPAKRACVEALREN